MRRLTIRRIELSSLARWGCVSGVLTALVPGLCLGGIAFSLLRAARSTVESWRNTKIDLIFGQSISVDFVELLHLQSLLDYLRTLDALGFFGVLLFTLIFGLLAGLFVGLNLVILGLIYNAVSRVSGGIGVDVVDSHKPDVPGPMSRF